MKLFKKDFNEEEYEAEIISVTCHDCGEHSDTDEEECLSCGSGWVTPETNIEGFLCDNCGHVFDMWESHHVDNYSHIVCTDCYDNELTDGDED